MRSYLVNQILWELVFEIITEGKEEFLNSLKVTQVKHRNNLSLCPVCNEATGRQNTAWAITDQDGKPIFFDRFNDDECGLHAIDWIKHVWLGYLEHVGPQKAALIENEKNRKQLSILRAIDWGSITQIQPLAVFAHANVLED